MREQGGTMLTKDERFKENNHGITLIGASNPDWDSAYLQAMSECSSMIVVATSEWAASPWCWQEFRQAGQEATIREHREFKCVMLQFPETKLEIKSMFMSVGWKIIPVEKIFVGETGIRGDFAEAASHKGGWVISENDLQQVLNNI